MAKPTYSYSVYDNQKKEFVIENKGPADVCKFTGLSNDAVVKYATTGYTYSERYLITRCKIDELAEELQPDDSIHMPTWLKEEWDKVRFKLNPEARR